jgi:Mce-associated membrane protein
VTSTETKPSPHPREQEDVEESPQETVEKPSRWRKIRQRVFRRKVLGVLVLVLLVAGGAVFGWLRIDHLSGLAADRDSALDAGKRYAASISTYDFRNPTANLDQVAGHSTDKFATEYRNSSAQLMQLITQYQATSQGNVLDAAVSEADGNHAVVLAFVDQTIKNTNLKDPRVDRSRMRLSLIRSGDEWKLDEITLL